MVAAHEYPYRRVRAGALDMQLPAFPFCGFPAAASHLPHVKTLSDGNVYDSQHGGRSLYLSDIDGEFSVPFDEFLGPVQRIHAPEPGPFSSCTIGDRSAFFRKNGNIGVVGLKA